MYVYGDDGNSTSVHQGLTTNVPGIVNGLEWTEILGVKVPTGVNRIKLYFCKGIFVGYLGQ